MLVQPRVVANGCKFFPRSSSTAVDEGERFSCDWIREMKATRTTSVALRRRTATSPINDSSMCLATVAKVAVIRLQVPVLSQFWRGIVAEKTVACGPSLLGIRIGRSQKLRKIIRNFSNICVVIPIQIVDRQRVFKPKKSVNVTCKETGSERASYKMSMPMPVAPDPRLCHSTLYQKSSTEQLSDVPRCCKIVSRRKRCLVER
jgi:hypothetical protein